MVGHFRNQMFTWPKGCSGMEVRGSDQYLCMLQVRTFLTNYRMNEPTSDERGKAGSVIASLIKHVLRFCSAWSLLRYQ